jgi:hypothetical protein
MLLNEGLCPSHCMNTPQGWRFHGYGVLQQIKFKNLVTSKEFNNKLKN